MKGWKNLYLIVAALILINSSLFLMSSLEITGRQSYIQNVYSEAQIQKYASISMSGNLSAGIQFGLITELPATNINATKNYNSTVDDSWHNETLYWIEVAQDSNTNVDLCVKSTDFNTSGSDEIDLSNYLWDDDQYGNNETDPRLSGAAAMSNGYVQRASDVDPSTNVSYRFWLSVPGGQAAGTYNSTVYFKAVETGIGCGL